MKLFDLFETDEFSNHEEFANPLEQLDRIQKARFHEFCICISTMSKKYPHLVGFAQALPTYVHFFAGSFSLQWFKNLILYHCSSVDQEKMLSKFSRMKKAKEEFEHAGGKYPDA